MLRLFPRLACLLAALCLAVTALADVATADPPVDPAAPSDVAITSANAALVIHWTAPTTPPPPNLLPLGYTATAVDAQNHFFSCPGPVLLTSCTIIGLTNGTSYGVTVRADYAIGGPVSSPSLPAIPYTTPDAPTAVTATAEPADGGAVVDWTAPSDNGGDAVTDYTVTADHGGQTCHSTTTSCTVSGLTLGDSYTFTVVATNHAGAGSTSAVSNAVTAHATTDLSISSVDSGVTYGGTVRVTGQALWGAAGNTADGLVVALQYRRNGSADAFQEWGTRTADGDGAVSFVGVRPTRSTEFRLVAAATARYDASTSPSAIATVWPGLTLRGSSRHTVGQTVRLTGRMSPAIGGYGVELQRADGHGWVHAATVRAASDGSYAFTVRKTSAARYVYRVAVRAGTQLGGAVSPSVALVYLAARSRTTIALSPRSIAVGRTATVSGGITPAQRGHLVFLQRQLGTRWATVARGQVTASGRYVFRARPTRVGRYAYRVYDTARPGRSNASASGTVHLTVRSVS